MSQKDDDNKIPLVALVLGLLGLIPFISPVIAILIPYDPFELGVRAFHMMLVTYAALIASFLGGVRWGLGLGAQAQQQTSLFVVSVCPSLVAWFALAVPRPYDLIVLMTLFLCLLVLDIQLVRQQAVPRWFGSLRLLLSGFVIVSLLGPLAFELGF